MTTKERVELQSIRLLLAERFYGGPLLSLELIEAKPDELSMPTAVTNGSWIKYNPEFIETLNDLQVRFILAHECWHNMALHTFRLGKLEDHETANIAADYEINGMMRKEIERCVNTGHPPPYELPPGAKDDPKYDGMVAEEIYHILMKEKGKNGNGNGPPGKGGKPGKGKGKPTPRPGDFEPPKDEPQRQKLEKEWVRQLIQAKHMGLLPVGLERFLEEIKAPTIPWQEVLRHFLTLKNRDNYNWRKPNKGYLSQGIWLPSLHSDCMGPVVIMQDTSGSMGTAELERSTAEAQGVLDMARPKKLFLMQIDAAVHSLVEYEPGMKIPLKCEGGGGSDMAPGFEKIEADGIEPEIVICITDLCVNFGKEPPYPVIWLTETKDGKAPFGEVIVMNNL